MSDDVKCDACGKLGRRPRFRFAPRGWLYLEAFDSEEPEDPIIMFACSRECAAGMWKDGPGPRLDGAPEPPSPAPHRTAAMQSMLEGGAMHDRVHVDSGEVRTPAPPVSREEGAVCGSCGGSGDGRVHADCGVCRGTGHTQALETRGGWR